jgi:hypothetical protein
VVFVVKTFETQWQSTPRTINEWNPVTITFAFCQGQREASLFYLLYAFPSLNQMNEIKLIKLNNLIKLI